jgi:hypothetical protein
MTPRDEQQEERDDLELEAETVKDLEPSPESEDDVFGGTRTTKPQLYQPGSHST